MQDQAHSHTDLYTGKKHRFFSRLALTAAAVFALGANETAIFMLEVPDLQARYFGLFFGITAGIALCFIYAVLRLIGRCFGLRTSKCCGLLLPALLSGYAAGALADSLYLGAFSDTLPFPAAVPLCVWAVLMAFRFFSVPNEQTGRSASVGETVGAGGTVGAEEAVGVGETASAGETVGVGEAVGVGETASAGGIVSTKGFPWFRKAILVVTAGGIFGLTFWWSVPELHREKVELPEGIYVYANDTVFDFPGLNLISSRWGGFVHTGICFLTRDPQKLHAECRKRGLPELKFFKSGKLTDGYWICDFNLEVCDRTLNITNYSSPAKPDDVPYPFDQAHWTNLLNGHSVNDRLAPAIQVRRLPVKDPLAAWSELQKFREEMNARYPDGFIYSPIPYRGHFVRFFNCNSLVVGAADEILGCGKEAEELTDMPFHFGGEPLAAGRELMAELRSEDFAQRLEKEREAMKDPPNGRAKFLHRFFSLADKPREETHKE